MPICLSIGEIIDRLVIVHLKQWHLEEMMADPEVSDEKKAEITDQIVSLNAFRMKLVAAIDEVFEDGS
jgi:hypothetical protein